MVHTMATGKEGEVAEVFDHLQVLDLNENLKTNFPRPKVVDQSYHFYSFSPRTFIVTKFLSVVC